MTQIKLGDRVEHSAEQVATDPPAPRADRAAFLLTWNPDRWSWDDYDVLVEQTQSGSPVHEEWSTGSRKGGIYLGDSVFLLRRLLAASGCTWPRDRRQWCRHRRDGRCGRGRSAHFVDVLWERLVAVGDGISVEVLQAELPTQNWTPMASGTEIKDPRAAEALELKWSEALGRVDGPGRGGQGRLSDAARRTLLEDAAQARLMKLYADEGWEVHDVRHNGPYDAIARRDGVVRYLEAKGTQGSGNKVFVTRGEVEHARQNHGDCVIGIWSGMRITDHGAIDPDAGDFTVFDFEPDAGILAPVQYQWTIPDEEDR